jgi:hypothetical protein
MIDEEYVKNNENAIKISYFANVKKSIPLDEVFARTLLGRMRLGAWQQEIEHGHDILKNQGETAFKKYKETLPCVTFAGTFAPRRLMENVVDPSGLLVGDLDDLADIDAVMTALSNDRYVYAAFRSPSWLGLKAIFKADGIIRNDADHKKFFAALERYLQTTYQLKLDPSGKDICRLCYVSYDPEMFINNSCVSFPIDQWSHSHSQQRPEEPHSSSDPRRRYAEKVLGTLCGNIRNANTEGSRHDVHLKNSIVIGGYIAGGWLDEAYAISQLQKAVIDSGISDPKDRMKTLKDGIVYGKGKPLDPPDREYDHQHDGGASAGGGQTSEDDSEEIDPETWPVLDHDAIHPGLISDFISAATANSEADPAAVLGTFITRLSVEVGRNPYLMIGDTKQHCNLLAAIAGPTGAGRKGTSVKPVERLFALGNDLYIPARITPGPLSSGEGLIYAVHDEIKKWETGKKSEPGRWVIVDPGVDDKRLFILTEEFSSALQAMAREGNTLSSIVRQIFDTGTLDPLTKSSKIKATCAHIGIVGHITIYELNGLLKENEIHNGLINRFLWFCSRRQKILPFPKPISDSDIAYFQSEIREIASFANETNELSLSAGGRELWEEYYPGLSESKGGFLGAVLERAAALVLRIAMLMALVDRTNQIGASQLQTAIMLWRYCESSAKYIFSDKAAQNPLIGKILNMLTKKPMSLTEISNEFNRNVSSASIRQAIKELMENKRITSKTIKTAGRDKTIYSLSK